MALLLVAAALIGPGNAMAESLPTGPAAGDQDISSFYRWPGSAPHRPGKMLRQEPLPADLTPRQAASATRILYITTDVRWGSGALAASGVLYLPRGRRPAGGWPLVVWAHGTLGMADSCAPSWTGANPRDRAYVSRWLDEGFAVVAPDYQGLGGPGPHPYLNPDAEGRSVLDSARAALSAGRGIANSIVITGQSQGSGATLGAARLAAGYAPDLRIKGAIATALVPVMPAEGEATSNETPGGSPYYLVYRMLGGGLSKNAPSMESLLSEKGKVLLAAARTRCDPRVVAQNAGVTMENAFTVPVAEVDALLGPAGRTVPFRVRFPLMLGIGMADELIAPARQEGTAKALCRAGNTVIRKNYAGARHGETLTRSADDAVAFARRVMGVGGFASDC